MRRFAFCLALLTAAACDLGSIFGPDDVRYIDRRPMNPVPPEYAELYAATELCLGMSGNFGAVQFFVADEIVMDGHRKAGTLKFPNDLTMWEHLMLTPWAVGHEFSHHITGIGDALHDELGGVPCQNAGAH